MWDDHCREKGKSASEDLKKIASSIQDQILISCIANKSALSVLHTNAILMAAADSKLEPKLTESDLQEFTKHISNNIHEFLKADLAATIASLIKLGIMPADVLDEIGNMNELTTLKGDSAFILLRQMVNSKILASEALYEKLWARVL